MPMHTLHAPPCHTLLTPWARAWPDPPGALSALAGRLLCDTYLSARELVKEVDYTLRTLARYRQYRQDA